MYIGDLFNILSDLDKDILFKISSKWKLEEQKKASILREKNKKSLQLIAKKNINPRLMTALLNYFDCYKDLSIDNYTIKSIDIKNVRGIGKELINEYNKIFNV